MSKEVCDTKMEDILVKRHCKAEAREQGISQDCGLCVFSGMLADGRQGGLSFLTGVFLQNLSRAGSLPSPNLMPPVNGEWPTWDVHKNH